MTPETTWFRRIAAALAVAAAFTAAATAGEAGKALFVAGTVTLERAPPAPLRQGGAVNEGDTVATGDKSRAQILMNDSARVALRANSRWRVDEFVMPGSVGTGAQATATRADGVSVATLLKGGFRSSTGAIGKEGAGTYEVRTPIGTLGIRGTDYTAVWCQGDCGDIPAAVAARNGLYLATHAGAIVFRYGGRVVVIEAGQVFFIAAADALPEPLEQLPEWLAADGAGPLVTGADDDAGQGQLPDFSSTHQPPPGTAPPDTGAPGGQDNVQRPITGSFGGQGQVDLTRGNIDQRVIPTDPIPAGAASQQPPPNTPPPPSSTAPPPATQVPPPPPPATHVPPPGGN